MSKVLKHGASGDEVIALQKSMVQLGYDLEIDGKFGEATKSAVLHLQEKFGYDVDGAVGDGTRHCIDKRIKEGWVKEPKSAAGAKAPGDGKSVDKGKSS